eukprot:3453570-Pleurochrysis_carterae.AAC.1
MGTLRPRPRKAGCRWASRMCAPSPEPTVRARPTLAGARRTRTSRPPLEPHPAAACVAASAWPSSAPPRP